MTDQEAFDVMVRHLAGMTERSLLPNGECAYRGRDGAKCAVGVLIPDDEYSEEMEYLGLELMCEKGLWPDSLSGLNISMLDHVQSVHDCGWLWVKATRLTGLHSLRRVANFYGLSDAVVDELEAACDA